MDPSQCYNEIIALFVHISQEASIINKEEPKKHCIFTTNPDRVKQLNVQYRYYTKFVKKQTNLILNIVLQMQMTTVLHETEL